MSQNLTISDSLYTRLETSARLRGFKSIEQLLEEWEQTEVRRRKDVVQHINDIQAQLYQTYGQMPDSVTLVREDRER